MPNTNETGRKRRRSGSYSLSEGNNDFGSLILRKKNRNAIHLDRIIESGSFGVDSVCSSNKDSAFRAAAACRCSTITPKYNVIISTELHTGSGFYSYRKKEAPTKVIPITSSWHDTEHLIEYYLYQLNGISMAGDPDKI